MILTKELITSHKGKMKRQRTLGFKPVSKKVRFFVTMPLTGVLSQCKINIKS